MGESLLIKHAGNVEKDLGNGGGKAISPVAAAFSSEKSICGSTE
ncbi:MAG: hypothetical protein R2911_12240 [Caldilineaceae bacterium]